MTEKDTKIQVAVIKNDLKYLRKSMDHLHQKIDYQNGRVKDAEDAGEANKNEISFIKGIGAVAVIIIPIIVSFIFFVLSQ